jgi:hypothetical protein
LELPVTLLDDAVEAYLGFRKDTGDRLKAALTAEPDFVLSHCLRGYFMMLFGQRAMVSRARPRSRRRRRRHRRTLERRVAGSRRRASLAVRES